MNEQQRNAIKYFNTAIKNLRNSGVIRSHRYLGDLAEFLCADAYDIDLATNLRQVGFDGIREQLRVQIKFGGGTKTNIDFGNPNSFEEVYIILGRDSNIRTYQHDADFLVYKLTSDEIKAMGKTKRGRHSCGKKYFNREPDKAITI